MWTTIIVGITTMRRHGAIQIEAGGHMMTLTATMRVDFSHLGPTSAGTGFLAGRYR
jgi:hypothetical protein